MDKRLPGSIIARLTLITSLASLCCTAAYVVLYYL